MAVAATSENMDVLSVTITHVTSKLFQNIERFCLRKFFDFHEKTTYYI